MIQGFMWFGSQDGTAWEWVTSSTRALLWKTNTPMVFPTITSKAYSHYRLVITSAPPTFEIGNLILCTLDGPLFNSINSYTVSSTNAPMVTPTPTPSVTATPAVTPTPTPSATPTPSVTSTPMPSATPTPFIPLNNILTQSGKTVATLSWSWTTLLDATQLNAFVLVSNGNVSIGSVTTHYTPIATRSSPLTRYIIPTKLLATTTIIPNIIATPTPGPTPTSGTYGIVPVYSSVKLSALVPIGTSANSLLRFTVMDTINGDKASASSIVPWQPYYTDLSGSIRVAPMPSTTPLLLRSQTRTSSVCTVLPKGGSGWYSYAWSGRGESVSSMTANSNGASTTFTVIMKASASTSTTSIFCQITDIISGATIIVSNTMTWPPYYTPVSLSLTSPLPMVHLLGPTSQTSGDYVCVASGGSGSYSFSWSVLQNAMRGEWIQVQWSSPKTLGHYYLVPRNTSSMFQGHALLGSTDGTNWYVIDIVNSAVWWYASVPTPFYVSHGTPYSYYRLVITQSSTSSATNVSGWIMYDVSGNPFISGETTVSGSSNQLLQSNGTTVATMSWSWDSTNLNARAVSMESQSQSVSNLLTTTGYTSTYLGLVSPTLYPASTNGIPTLAAPITFYSGTKHTKSNVTAMGEWIQVQFATSQTVTSFQLLPLSTLYTPQSILVVGSNNGTDWTYLMFANKIVWTQNQAQEWVIPMPNAFTSYRLIILQATSKWDIAGWILANTSGTLFPSTTTYTTTGTNGSVLQQSGTTVATLSWSWNASLTNGVLSSVSCVLTGTTTSIGMTSASLYPALTGMATGASTTTYAVSPDYITTLDPVNGEWVQVQLTTAVMMTGIQLVPRHNTPSTMIQGFMLFGSLDGTSWEYMSATNSPVFWTTNVPSLYTVMTSKAYSYYRLVVTAALDTFELGGFIVYTSDGPLFSNTSSYTVGSSSSSVFNNVLRLKQLYTLNGQWIQVQWSSSKILGSYYLVPRQTATMCKAFSMVGSNDGQNWFLIDTQSNLVMWNALMPTPFYVTHGTSYSYYRLVVTQSSVSMATNIAGWLLYDINGSSFTPTTTMISGAQNQFLVSGGNTVATVSWSWTNAYQESTTQSIASILLPTNTTAYLGVILSNDYNSNGISTLAAPSTFYDIQQTFGSAISSGEYIQVQLATPATVTSCQLWPTVTGTAPKSFLLLGSNDGSTWIYLMFANRLVWNAIQAQQWSIPATQTYVYYRLVVIQAPSTWDISGWVLSTASGPLFSNPNYTTTGTYGSILQQSSVTVATLSWSWAVGLLNGTPTEISKLLVDRSKTLGMTSTILYPLSTNGIATSAPTTVYSTIKGPSLTQTVSGEWIQIHVTSSVLLSSFLLVPHYATVNTIMQGFVLLGSNDGSTWHYITASTSRLIWNNATPMSVVCSPRHSYFYFRLVITSAPGTFDLGGFILNTALGPVISNTNYTLSGTSNASVNQNNQVATLTWSPSITVKATPTPMPSATPTVSPTPSPSATPSVSPTPSPLVTPSITPSVTPSITPSVSPTPSATPTVTPTPSHFQTGLFIIDTQFQSVSLGTTVSNYLPWANTATPTTSYSVPNVADPVATLSWSWATLTSTTQYPAAILISDNYLQPMPSYLGGITSGKYNPLATASAPSTIYRFAPMISPSSTVNVTTASPESKANVTGIIPVGPISTSLLRCTVTDVISGNQSNQTGLIVWKPYYTDLSGSITSVPAPTPTLLGASTQTSVIYRCTPTGGSGIYTYSWSASGGNVINNTVTINTPTASTTTFTALMRTGPSSTSTIACLITDTINGAIYSASGSVTWQPYYFPLTSTITSLPAPTPTLLGLATQTSVRYTCIPSGGSGSVVYLWSIEDGNVNSRIVNDPTLSNTTFTVVMNEGPSSNSTIRCLVSDTISGDSSTATSSVTWQPYYPDLSGSIVSVPAPTPTLLGSATQTSVVYTCQISGGSKSYRFNWVATGGNTSGIIANTSTLSTTTFTATMTIGLSSTSSITCTVTDNISGSVLVLNSSVTWQPYFESLSTTLTLPSTVTTPGNAIQTINNCTCTVTGGLGPYTYAWSLSASNAVHGEWIQVQWSTSKYLGSYHLVPRNTASMGQSFLVLGSSDGITWYAIDAINNTMWWYALTPTPFYTTHGASYSYYRLVMAQAPSTTHVAGWFMSDLSGASFVPVGASVSGNMLQNGGTTIATVTWSWDSTNISTRSVTTDHASQTAASILVNTNAYVGFVSPSEYPDAMNGIATISAPLTTHSGIKYATSVATVMGEWIQVQLATPSTVTSFQLWPNTTLYAPQALMLLGSNDGVTWDYLFSANQLLWSELVPKRWYIGTPTPFTFYRLVVTQATSTWNISGFVLSTISGPLFSGTYTTAGLFGSLLQVSGSTSTVATLSWSWLAGLMNGTPSNVAYLLTGVIPTYIGMTSTSLYPVSGIATSASVSLYTVSSAINDIDLSVAGEYVQIQLANATQIKAIQVAPRFNAVSTMCQSFMVLGSTDGLNWEFVMNSPSTVFWQTNMPNVFTVLAQKAYVYYRFVVTSASSTFDIGGIILCTSTGPLFSSYATYTITDNLLKSGTQTLATLSWSSMTSKQSIAGIVTSDGYTQSYISVTTSGKYASGLSTTSAAQTTYRMVSMNYASSIVASQTSTTSVTGTVPPGPATNTAIQCIVTDTYSNRTSTASGIITWQPFYYSTLNAIISATPSPTPAPTSIYSATQSGSYTCTASGGSGIYGYTWTAQSQNTVYGEWIQVQWTSPKILGMYHLVPRDTASMFRGFMLVASNDGIAWQVLDTVNNAILWTALTPTPFYASSGTAFSYYRLIITQATSSGTTDVAGWIMYDTSGNAFAPAGTTVSGAMNQNLVSSGTTMATVSWSWLSAGHLNVSQPVASLLTTTGYTSTYLGTVMPSSYPSDTNGIASFTSPRTVYTTTPGLSSSASVNGEYIQVELTTAITLASFQIWPRDIGTNPVSMMVLGSNNGTTWTYLSFMNRLVWALGVPLQWQVASPTFFSFYRLVIIQAPSSWAIGGWILSTTSGLALTGSYTSSVISSTQSNLVLSSNSSVAAKLTWSWASGLMNGSPTNIALILTSNTTFLGTTSSVYINGIASNLASLNTYTFVPRTTVVTSSVYGEYIQIQLASAVVMSSFLLVPRTDNQGSMLHSYVCLGSNNGTAWQFISSVSTRLMWNSDKPTSFTVPNTTAYAYYRLVVTSAPSTWDLGGWIIHTSAGPVFPMASSYTISGANNHILQLNSSTVATVTWSWASGLMQSTTQNVARILTNDGYVTSPAFLGVSAGNLYTPLATSSTANTVYVVAPGITPQTSITTTAFGANATISATVPNALASSSLVQCTVMDLSTGLVKRDIVSHSWLPTVAP